MSRIAPITRSTDVADSRALRAGLALAALMAALPAFAVTSAGNRSGGAAPSARTPAAASTAVSREGLVQSFDPAAQSIVINGSKFTIGPPQLALLDKRPSPTGLLQFADLKAGMFVRYRVEGQRVMELWIMRDPQRMGTRP
jgi:hypothetical protein